MSKSIDRVITKLHIYLTIAAISLAAITTYYPSSISLMLSLFKIVWINYFNAQIVWYNSFKSYETTKQKRESNAIIYY